jgi:uncharacterized membrane protein
MTSFYATTVLGSSLYLVLWLFVLCSVLGVVIEGVFFLATERVLESRVGLLYLPLRPLYGAGGVAYILLLHGLAGHPVLVFLLGALVATVVECLASLFTERCFDAVSWDYSDKRLNFQGRVCLQYSLAWGVLALVAVYVVDPPLRRLLGGTPGRTGELLLTVVMVAVLLSAALTAAVLVRTRRRVDALRARAADESARGAGPALPRTRPDRVLEWLAPDPVLVNSFPRMSLVTELLELTGQDRVWLRVSGHARRPQPERVPRGLGAPHGNR